MHLMFAIFMLLQSCYKCKVTMCLKEKWHGRCFTQCFCRFLLHLDIEHPLNWLWPMIRDSQTSFQKVCYKPQLWVQRQNLSHATFAITLSNNSHFLSIIINKKNYQEREAYNKTVEALFINTIKADYRKLMIFVSFKKNFTEAKVTWYS